MAFFFLVIVVEKSKAFVYLFIIFEYRSIRLLMTNSRGMNSQHRHAIDRYCTIHRILYIVPEDIMVG